MVPWTTGETSVEICLDWGRVVCILVYNDGKRFYKKLNEKFKKVAKDIFETMSGMSQPQEGEQYQEYSEDSTGNKGKVLDIASNRLKALSAKLQNNRKAIQGKNLLAEAENWRVASIEVKKGLEDALRTCRTNNDRITMKSALKQFNFMNLAMERRISENADLYEEILEHEVKINHLEKLNERMDEESKKKSSRVTGLEKHVEKVNAKLNEMKNKQKQMKTEMEKVKNAKVTQAAQAEIDKALATVNAQMEDVKAKAEQDIKLLNEKIETQEKEFQEKVASLEAEVEDCQSTITKLNIALDNLDCQLNDALDKQDEYANRLDVTENQSKAKQSRQESIREQYKDQLKNYKREVDTLEKELESMKQDMKSKEELIQTQEEKIAEILAQLKGVRRSPVQPAKDFAAPGSPNEFKQYIARLKSDYDHEIHMLQEHNAKEKLRSEAAMRRMTQEAHTQLNSIHKESLVLLRAINRFKDSTAAIFDKEGLADIGHEIKQMQNLTTDEVLSVYVRSARLLELKLSQAFMNKRLELKEALMPKQRSMAPAVNSEVNAEIDKLTKENETLNEKLEKDEKYQALLDRHKGMILHSSNLQRELKQLEEAFRKEMKKRDSKLRSMRGSLAEQARNHQVLVNRLEMSTVPEEPEKPDISQLKLKVKDQMKNLEMLQGALKENKISLELHTITVDIINQAMEVPEMRLRQMFERYSCLGGCRTRKGRKGVGETAGWGTSAE
ncbi:putative paramyosin-like [Apostichopus japonicus]|uniref:Putative paramyosin-like n=1 Tax=Stichopus japonicus TaxID=307972 RepID=A0A2G8LGY5_STIJA|nr:putative paramyosin-like [Apostichopus japonicus]